MIWLGGILLVICALGNLYWGLSFYNPDIFLLPGLYKDLVVRQGHWFFWTFPKARYFFPDMPVYFALKQFFPGSYLAPYFAQMCLHLLVLGLFAVWFFRRFFKKNAGEAFLMMAGCIAFLASPLLDFTGVVQGVFWPTEHAGGLAMMLVSTMVFFESLKGKQWILLPLAFLGGFSDPLYILAFALPAAAVQFRRKERGGAASMLVVSFLGMVLAEASTPYFFDELRAGIFHAPALSPMIFGFVPGLLKMLWFKPLAFIVLVAGVSIALKRMQAWKTEPGMFFAVSAVLPLAAGMLLGTPAWRYFPQLLFLNLFLMAGVLSARHLGRGAMGMFYVLVFLSVLGGWAMRPYPTEVAAYYKVDINEELNPRGGFSSWRDLEYPFEVSIIDQLKERYGLHEGLAIEQLCRPVNILSQKNACLHQINGKGRARLWLNTMQEYGVRGISERPGKHDFIITYLLDEGEVARHFGLPIKAYRIRLFPDESADLWVYAPGVLDAVLGRDQMLALTMAFRLKNSAYLLDEGARRVIAR